MSLIYLVNSSKNTTGRRNNHNRRNMLPKLDYNLHTDFRKFDATKYRQVYKDYLTLKLSKSAKERLRNMEKQNEGNNLSTAQ